MRTKRSVTSALASAGLITGTLCAQLGLVVPHAAALTTHHITTCSELQAINDDSGTWGDTFVLDNNIDCSDTVNWNDGAGFTPIGLGAETGFTGTFDGQGYTISDLYINHPSDLGVGLFSEVDGGTVENIDFTGGSVAGSFAVGLVAGAALDDATLTGITADTSTGVPVTGDEGVGGIVGWALGTATMTDFAVSGTITGTSGSGGVGGIVGELDGGDGINTTVFNNAATTGAVSGAAFVGGVAGLLGGSFTADHLSATGAVTADAGYGGGLIGQIEQLGYSPVLSSSLDESYATGDVTAGTGGSGYFGGLIGDVDGDSSTTSVFLDQVYATGTVDASAQTELDGGIGGLVGELAHGVLTNAYATGDVTTESLGWHGGGLVGDTIGNDTTISNTYATGAVTAYNYLGGLVGSTEANIYNSFAIGTVDGLGNESVDTAGLVGVICGTDCGGGISNSYWSSTDTGQAACNNNFDNTNVQVTAISCTDESASYYNNNTSGVFSPWNFTTIWETHTSAPPTLRF